MHSFSIAFDLKPNMRNGLKKFAQQSYQAYTQLLLSPSLKVSKQMWYLVPLWPSPSVTDQVIIYTESNDPTVVQGFCELLVSLAPPQIALDCKRTCRTGTSGIDWQATPPTQPYDLILEWSAP